MAMKRMAVTDRDYPVTMAPDGMMVPISLSRATSENAKSLIETILDFAFARELWLMEYNAEGKPEKQVHGAAVRGLPK